jgi:hypothetical protein
MLRRILLFSMTVTLAGCASNADAPNGNRLPAEASAILDKATEIELLSLDPSVVLNDKDGQPAPKPGVKKLHGWDILGQTTIKDAEQRKQVKEALLKGISDSDGTVADCFDPRHGLRASHDGKTVELVICFRCLQLQVYVDGKRSPTVLTTRSPQAVLNALLKKAKIPIAD